LNHPTRPPPHHHQRWRRRWPNPLDPSAAAAAARGYAERLPGAPNSSLVRSELIDAGGAAGVGWVGSIWALGGLGFGEVDREGGSWDG